MKNKFLKIAITGLMFFVGGYSNIVNANVVTIGLNSLNNFTPDFVQAGTGPFNSLGNSGNGTTFNQAQFGALNGTTSTTDASRDSATFKLSVDSLAAFTSGENFQYLFESGAGARGIGIKYGENNILSFGSRQDPYFNVLSLDVTSLIGTSFDIVASLSLDGNLMNFFAGDLFDQLKISTNFVDWDGGGAGGFGDHVSHSLFGNNNAGQSFTAGTLSNFSYYNNVVVVPEPTPIALLGLSLVLIGYRRRQMKSA
jgi:hypothetical protein